MLQRLCTVPPHKGVDVMITKTPETPDPSPFYATHFQMLCRSRRFCLPERRFMLEFVPLNSQHADLRRASSTLHAGAIQCFKQLWPVG